MVSPKLLNMNNSTNLYSITSILIYIYPHKTRKDVHNIKPVREQGINPMRHYSSRYKNKRRQGQDFLGHWLQLQGSPFEISGEYPITGNKRASKIPKEPVIWAGKKQNPATRVESPEEIERSITSSISHRKYIKGTPKSKLLETVQIGHGW